MCAGLRTESNGPLGGQTKIAQHGRGSSRGAWRTGNKGNSAVIRPVLQDEEFLLDVQRARLETDQFNLWWLGQSGFLLQWNGHHLLFDPYLSDSLTRKYAGTEKPHVRMTELVIAPRTLTFIDVVTSSHNHTDHL